MAMLLGGIGADVDADATQKQWLCGWWCFKVRYSYSAVLMATLLVGFKQILAGKSYHPKGGDGYAAKGMAGHQ